MSAEEYARIAAYLAHLAAGWRDGSDLETLARLPDGMVYIDVLSGLARHETAGPIALRLASALQGALAERLARKGIPAGALETAALGLRVDSGAIRTDRNRIVHFDFGIEAAVRADGREHLASRREDHVWHAREAEGDSS
jgi:hypothetical protein